MLSLEFTPSPESVRAVEQHARLIASIVQPDARLVTTIADAIREGFAESFRSESSAGDPWEPLAAWTIAERIRQGYGGEHPILVRGGDYRRSWVDDGHPDHVSRIELGGNEFSVVEGSSHAYAATHEMGGTTDTGHTVPPRPVRLLSEDAEREIERRILAWLTRTLP
jgi:phage gpG-like protein